MSGQVIELDDAGFAAGVALGVVVVDFYGAWCPPCKLLDPVLARIAADFAGRATVARVNVDDYSEAAADNSVIDIPTLIFFKNGSERRRLMGAHSETTIAAELNRLLA